MVKHLAYVERYWFQRVIAGRDVSVSWLVGDEDGGWRLGSDEGRDAVIAFYEREVARHAGHMDIIRELIDGATGTFPGTSDASAARLAASVPDDLAVPVDDDREVDRGGRVQQDGARCGPA